jgi:drug/metabolite transporter (DMT)-like permease
VSNKNYLAYLFLVLATLCWSGNFIVGKFATLYEIPPLTLNVFRWISVWFILVPFTYKEIFENLPYIKKNWLVISFMGVITISTFNSVVYFALNYTQVINAVLMLAAIPAATIVLSSLMKIEETNIFQLLGLVLSIIGIGSIISNGNIQKIIALDFNKGDIWMLVCVITWSLYSTLLKKNNFKFSQFTLIQLMVSVGILFLIPQFFYEKSIGLELNFNKDFYLILIYVAIFPAIAAYYFWQKGVAIIGPNRASMFIQLMPLFSAIMAIIFFEEIFELYHFVGAIFILSGIYLSNKKVHA